MIRLKQILLGLTAILGGVLLTDGVYALQFSDTATELSFEFTPTLTLTLSGDLAISNLAPGQCLDGGTLSATVSTNNNSGYTLGARMNGSTQTLAGTNSSENTFSALTNATGTLSKGNWGIRVGSDTVTCTSATYTKLNVSTGDDVVLNKTTNMNGTAASGYTGTTATAVRVGAYAADAQPADTYTNTILFTAVSN